MQAVIQRVRNAEVTVEGESVGKIGRGILGLVAIEKGDDHKSVERLAQKILGYRIFPDESGRMNLKLGEIGGELLLVSQFTLAADTAKGMRPSFTPAADPETGRRLFDQLVDHVRLQGTHTQTGRFGADMKVSLINDGPVTFILKA